MRMAITSLLFFLFLTPVRSQDLLPLKYSKNGQVSFYWGKTKMLADKNTFTLDTLVEIKAGGGGGSLQVDSLIISNKTFTSADIKLSVSRCGTSEYVEQDAGAFYISIAFFDTDSNFVFGHSMISDNGFSLAGASHGLQATTLIPYPRNDGEYDCFDLIGETELAIHQAFLYDPENPNAGGILPIYFVSFRVFSLGAG